MIKTNKICISIPIILVCGLICLGCDVGINPLLFDGTPITASFPVNTTGTSYSGSVTLNLNDIVKDIPEQIDSADVFNITIQVEDTSGNTPAGTTISGTAKFNGTNLLVLSNVPLSALSGEKSIFDQTIPGFAVNTQGFISLQSVIQDISQNPEQPHEGTFDLQGTASNSPLEFIIHVKIYTQIYTN